MTAAELALNVPPFVWLPALALVAAVLAEHRWLAPRLIAKRHRIWRTLPLGKHSRTRPDTPSEVIEQIYGFRFEDDPK